jgi:hypothetical protein
VRGEFLSIPAPFFVGWVEGRNPTHLSIIVLMLGFTSFNPTYKCVKNVTIAKNSIDIFVKRSPTIMIRAIAYN